MTKLYTKPAASGLYHHSYDPITVASMDFSKQVVSRIIECQPKDMFNKIACSADLLIAPQVFPPYGRCYLKTAAFFVPEHQLIEQSEAFHMNQGTYKGDLVVRPRISLFNLMNGTLSGSTFNSTVVKTLSSSTPNLSPDVDYPSPDTYDYINVHSGAGGIVVYDFMSLSESGKRYYKLMKSLGYDFISPTFMFYATPPSGKTLTEFVIESNDIMVDALPILAYFKVFYDMFYPATMYNSNAGVANLKKIHDNQDIVVAGVTKYDHTTGVLEADRVFWWYYDANVPVHQDMYTEAWNNPNSPTSVSPTASNPTGLIGPYLPQDNYNTDTLSVNSRQSQLQNHLGNTLAYITPAGLKVLNAFDKFVTRWNLAGTRAAQRVYAMFGIEPDAMKSNYVHKLYEGSELLRFHPVVSNADTSASGGLGLGDFAGFGAGSLNFEFNYKCTDYGFIIIVHWLQLKPILLHGVDPSVLRKDPFDWYTPEYDGQAMRAIPNIEISLLKDRRIDTSATAYPRGDKEIYGFTNIYDEYREMKDIVIGDFVSGQSKNFLFARDYTSLRSQASSFAPQTDDVQFMTNGYTQPFQMAHSVGDRFWCQFSFNIDAERPMLPKSDALDLGSGDTDFNKNGQIIN